MVATYFEKFKVLRGDNFSGICITIFFTFSHLDIQKSILSYFSMEIFH